jgi:hypothetical protein
MRPWAGGGREVAMSPSSSEKARRRADQALLVAYHEARLAELLERLRAGFREYDAGRIDAFELDALVHRYSRSARELWKFCAVSGAQVETAVRTLEYWRERGEQPDWCRAGAPPGDRP